MTEEEELSVDFSSYRLLILKLFKIIFFDVRILSKQKSQKVKLQIILKNAAFVFVNLNSILFYTLIFINESRKADMTKATLILTCFLTPVMIILRSMTLFMNKSNIAKVLKNMKRSYTKKEEKNCEFENFRKIYQVYVRAMLTIATLSTFVFYIAPIWKFIETGDRIFTLVNPFHEVSMTSHLYPFALIWSMWAFGSSMIILSLANEIVMHSAITIVAFEFQVLKKKFQELQYKTFLEERLKKYIDRHNQILDNVKKIEKIIRVLISATFSVASIQICSCLFLASLATEFSTQLEMLFYCFFTLLKVWFDFNFGETLQTSSERLVFGIYDCGWEDFKNPKLVKKIILSMQAAQNPKTLKVFKFIKLNLHQYWNVSFYLLKI